MYSIVSPVSFGARLRPSHTDFANGQRFLPALRSGLTGVLLLVFTASAARADDMMMLTNAGLNALATNLAILFLVAYGPGVWAVEAAILKFLAPLGYWKWFMYSTVANIVSTAISLLWYFRGEQQGWKTALLTGSPLLILFLRSYLVTVAEETVVIALLIGSRSTFRRTLGWVAAANALTYLIGLVVVWIYSP
jgi:hypothetical protein